MRTFVATALLAYASADADETSLMQNTVAHSASHKLTASSDTTSNRQDSTKKLLDTAVSMIKNGVTPDVITFVDATNQDINEEVLIAIQNEHDLDQGYINSLCQDFENAVNALTAAAADIAEHDSNAEAAREAHHTCRATEALLCAKSRRCEEQLRQRWERVKHEETVMRHIHDSIHEEWCIHPPFFAEIDAWLDHDFNWAQTSPYPILSVPADVKDFRHVSVHHFHQYMEQKTVVETAWRLYNEKLEECALHETAWEDQVPVCDTAQTTLRQHACEHATLNRQAREEFGQEWDRITTLFETARIAKTANEQDRKNEWETLKIVQCLLDHVHSSVITSIETGAPCPTIDSDPDGVTLAIEDCHIVTRGCGEDSMTAHLCLDWCEPPPIPPLPPVEPPACTPAYVAKEQAQFLEAIQTTYTTDLAADNAYPDDPLTLYETTLSEAGWAGCAPPLVCVDCAASEPQPPVSDHTAGAHECHKHEEYLSAGQSNADTFRCLDGTCIAQAGRCNGVDNCADGSDETGCDAETLFVPAYLATSSTCPSDFHEDAHYRCASGECIEKIGLCNGIPNCGDESDEGEHCTNALSLTVEATSGRTITVETVQSNTGVFHDRGYNFDTLGHFQGKTLVKYSNDDKDTDLLHVMIKLRTLKPTTVFILKPAGKSLRWLEAEGYAPSSVDGVAFSGVRETRAKEWDTSLLTTDHFDYSSVYSKTFPAGTISIPGNNGGDGSYLIFVEKASVRATDIRLAGGTDTSGRVEVLHEGQWGTVCDDAFSMHDATVVCRALGFTHARTAIQRFGGGSGQIWMDNLACDGTQSHVTECGHNGWGQHNCNHGEDVGVECANGPVPTPELRIHGGSNSGRLEILHDGQWGTICDDAWGIEDARVACRQMGYADATAAMQSFGGGSGQIWFDNVGCTGEESSIDECDHNGWGQHNCGHHEDAGVTCTD